MASRITATRPHHLQTTLAPAQEAVAVALRKLLISLDDLVAVVQGFLNPNVSRSGLANDLGVGNLLREPKANSPVPEQLALNLIQNRFKQFRQRMPLAKQTSQTEAGKHQISLS